MTSHLQTNQTNLTNQTNQSNFEQIQKENIQNTNINSLLKQKIREQAKRLCDLQKYKGLCEARIKQISPSHPVPITEQHLLLKKEMSSETNFSFGNSGFELAKKQNQDYKQLLIQSEEVINIFISINI